MVLGIKLIFPDGTSQNVKALIDTGAEVNLVNRNLIAPHLFQPSPRPVRLGAANSTRLCGGSQEVATILSMPALDVESKRKLDFRLPFVAYDADIKHDVIISFSWLVDNAAYLNFQRLGLYFKDKEELIWVQGLPTPDKTGDIITLRSEVLCDVFETPQPPSPPTGTPPGYIPPALNPPPATAHSDTFVDFQVDVNNVEVYTQQLQNWGLQMDDPPLPGELKEAELLDANPHTDIFLSYADLEIIAQHLMDENIDEDKDIAFIKGFVQSRNPMEGPCIDDLRQRVLRDYQPTVFSGKTTGNPPVRGPHCEAEIILKPGAVPTKQRAFTIAGERRAAWVKLIDQLLEDGKIEPGHGAWNSPSFPVPKKLPGDYRLVVDFRKLNDATEVDAHPLPRIEDILQRQGNFKIWSVLDMKDGYHQVPLKEEHRDLTCMSTPRGTMRWKVLVMGLRNGNAIFQRMMEHVLRDIPYADAYVDDVIIGSTGDTEEEVLKNHERDLRHVLDVLAHNQLFVDQKKAHLFMREVEFCGHVLREGKKVPSPGKLSSIQKWELPQTISQLRGFLGLANYYSVYVRNYAQLAGPLMELLKVDKELGKKGSKVLLPWSPPLVQAFEVLKKALTVELELFQVEPDAPFRVCTDASNYAIGGVLEQERHGIWVPVAFYSRKLANGQLNWTPREKEAYAIVACLWKWAGWVACSPIEVVTDHKSLEDWVCEYVTTPSGPTGRRARWHEILSQFNLNIMYRPGGDNVVADAMSRWAYPTSSEKHDVSTHGSAASSRQVKAMETADETEREFDFHGSLDKENESFKLYPPVRQKAVKELHLDPHNIIVDLFASPENTHEKHFITLSMDAFSFDWSKLCTTPSDILWANPPFSMMEKVVTKIAMEPCKVALCVPIWKIQPWWKKLQHLAVAHVSLPHNGRIYVEGWNENVIFLPPPSWDSAIYFLDSTKWSTPTDPQVSAWVREHNLGKGWPELQTETNNKEILVTLRSGKVSVEPQEDTADDIHVSLSPPMDSPGEPPVQPSVDNPPDPIAEPRLQTEIPPLPTPERPKFNFWAAMTPAEQQDRLAQRAKNIAHPRVVQPRPPTLSYPNTGIAQPLLLDHEGVLFIPWGPEYAQSAHFSPLWNTLQNPVINWPTGVQMQKDKIYLDGKLCVPESLVLRVIADFHSASGHMGKKKTCQALGLRYVIPPAETILDKVRQVKDNCLICQKCERQYWQAQGPIEPLPVPEKIMSSVCLDIFSLPEVDWHQQKFDSMLLCVDRLSGWVVAKPTTKLGLTAEKAAHLMLDNCWDLFGVPIQITSDQGAQFIGQWWKTLCARMGIRQAYSQAYWPRANGRAERAGQQIFELLKKMHMEESINWVEALPRILYQLHNTLGPSGLSPYQIVFGRERNSLGIPYPPHRSCEDAEAFMDRMLDLDLTIAHRLNELHLKEAVRINATRKSRRHFCEGDKVWLLKPKSLASQHKIENRWNGPLTVTQRVGQSSYVLVDSYGDDHAAHLSQLKPYKEDPLQDYDSTLLEFKLTTNKPTPPIKMGEIRDHRITPNGGPEFLTVWSGTDPSEGTWEKANVFVKYNFLKALHDYCTTAQVRLDVTDLL